MASRPLLSPLGKENTLDPLSYERGGVNLALGRSSDTETGQQGNLHVVAESRENESLCCNVLASGKLFRYITKATGLWNPREKLYGILCGLIDCWFKLVIAGSRNIDSEYLWALCRSLPNTKKRRDK